MLFCTSLCPKAYMYIWRALKHEKKRIFSRIQVRCEINMSVGYFRLFLGFFWLLHTIMCKFMACRISRFERLHIIVLALLSKWFIDSTCGFSIISNISFVAILISEKKYISLMIKFIKDFNKYFRIILHFARRALNPPPSSSNFHLEIRRRMCFFIFLTFLEIQKA